MRLYITKTEVNLRDADKRMTFSVCRIVGQKILLATQPLSSAHARKLGQWLIARADEADARKGVK